MSSADYAFSICHVGLAVSKSVTDGHMMVVKDLHSMHLTSSELTLHLFRPGELFMHAIHKVVFYAAAEQSM